MPIGLDTTYVCTLERLRAEFPEEIPLINNILAWLVFALRPLKSGELAKAVVHRVDQSRMSFSAIPTDATDLLQFCGGLISFSAPDQSIGLAQCSIKEFLLSHRIGSTTSRELSSTEKSGHAQLATVCLSDLAMEDFGFEQCPTVQRLVRRFKTFKLFAYAAKFWMSHFKVIGVDDDEVESSTRAFKFLSNPTFKNHVLSYRQVLESSGLQLVTQLESVHFFGDLGVTTMCPLYLAAVEGVWPLTKLLLDAGYGINDAQMSSGFQMSPTLHAAAEGKNGRQLLT